MSQQAFTFSGEAAKNYDQYLGPFLFEPSALMLSALVPEHFKGKVLELAAGTGRLTQHLVRRLANPEQLFVTDLNPDMLAIAKEKLDHGGLQFQAEDMQQLSFEDQSFDLVICQYGVMFPPDKAQVFREMQRVLKPGGSSSSAPGTALGKSRFSISCLMRSCCLFFKRRTKPNMWSPFICTIRNN